METQPNILLIMADQMAAPFMAPWGGPAIAPAIDRLAAEGVVFESTYSNSPLCAPARFAMMAGQQNSKIGAYDNASEFASTVPTFAHYMRSAGYQTSLAGKMHFVGPDQLHGFEERLTTDIYPADFGWTPNWLDPHGRFDWWYHNLDSVTHAGVGDATNQLDYDDDVGFRAVRKLRDLARTKDERPFMMTASFTHPHDPYVARQEFWDLYDDVEIPMPSVGPLDEKRVDPHSARLRKVIGADETQITNDQIMAARRAYLANCSYVDHWIGELLDTLEYHGLADDTIVIFTADHGDMLGERGLWYKMNFFEHSARVPLIVHAPKRFAAARLATLSSLLDIAPTMLDLAGIDVPRSMDGYSLIPQLGGFEDTLRTVTGEYLGEGAVAPIFMLRQGKLKFIYSEPDGEQLYDLKADPRELENVADAPEYLADATSFRTEVKDRWDTSQILVDVLDSQANRRVVDHALRKGRYWAWDFQPTTDASGQYMRNHLDLNEVESGRRSR
ncbi:MAG: choline-sulfatase [Acidimicrobiales bacterium]|jgi:choline-sulfatase